MEQGRVQQDRTESEVWTTTSYAISYKYQVTQLHTLIAVCLHVGVSQLVMSCMADDTVPDCKTSKAACRPLLFSDQQIAHPKGACDIPTHSLFLYLFYAVITRIASLVVGYDMRRLNDITAFRRYWYSTSLVETLFIGSKSKPRDEGVPATPSDSKSTSSTFEEDSVIDIDNTISATIAVAAKVEDFRVAANFAQVMGHAE